MWTADGRFVQVNATRTICIKNPDVNASVSPVQNLPLKIQDQVIFGMLKPEWYGDVEDKNLWEMTYNRWGGGPNLLFVAWFEDSAMPLGCVGVDHSHTECGTALLSHMWVSPQHRNRGVASGLVGIVEKHVRECMQHTKVLLYCTPDLEAFYDKLGYRKVDTSGDNIVMCKDMNQ